MNTDLMKNNSYSPLVSVFVASYNNSSFIIESLDSVKNQTYSNIELIIVDDASSDNSIEVINDWIINNNYTCKFIINEVNKGICGSSNVFLSAATGEFISWLASDDIMLPEKIEVQVALLNTQSQDVGVVYSDAYLMGKDGEIFFSKFIQKYRQFVNVPQGDVFFELLQGNFIPVMSVLWRRECFETCGYYDETLAYEDYDMLLRISRKYKFIFSSFISVKYRIHGENFHLKTISSKVIESDLKILSKHLGISSEIDALLKTKLQSLLFALNKQSAELAKQYVESYASYFGIKGIAKLAILNNIQPHHYARLKRIFTFLPSM